MGKGKTKQAQASVDNTSNDLADQIKSVLRDVPISVAEISAIQSDLLSAAQLNIDKQRQKIFSAVDAFIANINSKAKEDKEQIVKLSSEIDEIFRGDKIRRIFLNLKNNQRVQQGVPFPNQIVSMFLVRTSMQANVTSALINFKGKTYDTKQDSYRLDLCNLLFRIEILILHCACIRACNTYILESAIQSYLAEFQLSDSEFKKTLAGLKSVFQDEKSLKNAFFNDDTLQGLINLRSQILENFSDHYGLEFYRFLTLFLQNAFNPRSLAESYQEQIKQFFVDPEHLIVFPEDLFVNIVGAATDMLQYTVRHKITPEQYKTLHDDFLRALSIRQKIKVYKQDELEKLGADLVNSCVQSLQDTAEIYLGKHKNKFYLDDTKQKKERLAVLPPSARAELSNQIAGLLDVMSGQARRILIVDENFNSYAYVTKFFNIYQDFCSKIENLIASALDRNSPTDSRSGVSASASPGLTSLNSFQSLASMASDSDRSSPPLLYSPKQLPNDSWEEVHARDIRTQRAIEKQQRRNAAGSAGASASTTPTSEIEEAFEAKHKIVSAQELYARAITDKDAANFLYDLISGEDVQIYIKDLHRIFKILEIEYQEIASKPGHFKYNLPDGSFCSASPYQESGGKHSSSSSGRVLMHHFLRTQIKNALININLTKDTWDKFANPDNSLKPS